MKKTLAAITAGLLLVAGQSVAQNNAASVRFGDRVGAQAGDSSQLAPSLIALLLAVVVGGIVVISDDDEPSSP